jgi:tetratricopeptide (TPR) repeat protein
VALEPAQRSPTENKPDFEIQVEDGRGLLLLRPRLFFGWLRADQLELAIPNVRFPLDITGGMSQFQKQTCRIVRARLRVEASAMRAFVGARAERLAQAGFENVRARFAPGAVTLSGRARVGERSADFTARARVEHDGREVRLVLADARVYGYLRRPAPLLAHDLLCVLVGATRAHDAHVEAPRERGLADVIVRPLELFLGRVLPVAGWRLPDVNEVRVEAAALDEAGAELRYGPGEPSGAVTGDPPWRAGDDALLSADLGGALARYREARAADSTHARAFDERILSVLAARDATLREAVELAQAALARWPDFVPGELALAQAANARGRDDEAVAHLERVITMAGADDEVAVRAALTAARQVPDPVRAAELYERVLSRRPDEVEAADALAALHLAAGRYADVVRVVRGRIAAADSDRERAAAHVRIAEVLASKQADYAGARDELDRAVALDESNRRAWELLARARAELDDPRGAVEALDRVERLPPAGDDAMSRARTLVRAASQLEHAGDPDAARTLYARALTLTPEDAAILEKAADLAVARGQPREAIALLPRLIAACPADPWRRRRAQSELLRLVIDQGDVDAARRLLGESQLDPDAELLTRMAALEHAAGRADAAIAALARAARLAAADRVPAIELERGRLCAVVGRADEARAAFEVAYARAPDAPTALDAARELTRLMRAVGDAAAEARWLDVLLAGRPGTTQPDDYTRLVLRRAELALAAGDAALTRRLLDVVGDAAGAPGRRLYADALGALGDFSGRAAVLESLADDANDPAEQVPLVIEAARAHLRSGQLEPAQLLARRAEAHAPDDAVVHALLADVAFQARAWEDVVALYRKLLPRASAGERVEQTRRLAVALERLGMQADALGAYRQAVAAADADGTPLAAAWRGLAELEERAGDYGAAARWLRAAADDARTGEPPEVRADLLRRAAALLHRRVGAPADAAATLEQALRVAPGESATLDALEALYAEAGDEAALKRVLARRADSTRAVHLRELERDPRSLAALRFLSTDAVRRADRDDARTFTAQLAELATGDEKRGALITLAHLERDAGRVPEAEARYWAAIELSPAPLQVELLAQLEELFERAERWSDLSMALTHHASLVGDVEQAALESRRVRVLLERMQNEQGAADACIVALSRWPHDERFAETCAAAVRALEGAAGVQAAIALAFTRAGAAQEAALDLVSEKVRAGGADADVADALSKALRDRAGELRASDRVLDRAAGRLFVELQVAVSSSENWLALADGLAAAADVAPDPRTGAEWLRESARVLRDKLADPPAAADAFERALWLVPDDDAAVAELEPLLRERGELDRLSAAWERHLETLSGMRRSPILRRLAALWTNELGDAPRGQRYLDAARTCEVPAEERRVKSAALGRAVAPPDADPALVAKIRAMEEKLGTLSIGAELAQIRAARLELATLRRRAGQLEGARALLETVLAEEPSSTAGIAMLVEIDLQDGRFLDAAAGMERLAQLASDPAGRAECLYRAGEILRTRLASDERAADAYFKAIDVDPRHVPTLRRLVAHFYRAGDPAAVLEMAAALDDEAALIDEASGADGWARVAVAAALASDARRATRMVMALGPAGPEAIARALVEATWSADAALVEATRVLTRAGAPLDALRIALESVGAHSLAARLAAADDA